MGRLGKEQTAVGGHPGVGDHGTDGRVGPSDEGPHLRLGPPSEDAVGHGSRLGRITHVPSGVHGQ